MPATAATIDPLLLVLRSDEVTFVVMPFVAFNWPPIVVDAVTARVPVDVAPPKSRLAKCEVDEAKMPFCAQIADEVAAVITP